LSIGTFDWGRNFLTTPVCPVVNAVRIGFAEGQGTQASELEDYFFPHFDMMAV
jgi:hypothetical protein